MFTLDIIKVVKFYFSNAYEDSEIEAALKDVEFYVKITSKYPTKSSINVPAPSSKTPPVPNLKQNFVSVPTSKHNETIQKWVQRIFRFLLGNHILTQQEIVRLHDKWYSQKTFGVAYAMFTDSLKETVVSGHNRYWKNSICGYYICSQWWLDHEKEYYSNIKQWLDKVYPDYVKHGLDRH